MSAIEDPRPRHDDQDTVPVDWALASRTAARLVRPGPTAYRDELVALVEDLRESATEAVDHVATLTGLPPARPEVRVIDRSSWARVNVEIVERLSDGAITSQTEAGARVSALELGSGVALLSGKILGQFDPFSQRSSTFGGQLLLVAPNVLMIERELGLEPGPFRLWVCLHEQTHATQFGAAPWLAEHLQQQLRRILASLDEGDSEANPGGNGLGDILAAAGRLFRDEDHEGEEELTPALIDNSLSQEQRIVFDEITAIMSLLEGHADVVMDAVGPAVIPEVDQIRQRFEQRRNGGRRLDRVLRRLMGLDAKLAQYRNGAAFVREVMNHGGHATLNRVWESPETLPRPEEISEPQIWLDRLA